MKRLTAPLAALAISALASGAALAGTEVMYHLPGRISFDRNPVVHRTDFTDALYAQAEELDDLKQRDLTTNGGNFVLGAAPGELAGTAGALLEELATIAAPSSRGAPKAKALLAQHASRGGRDLIYLAPVKRIQLAQVTVTLLAPYQINGASLARHGKWEPIGFVVRWTPGQAARAGTPESYFDDYLEQAHEAYARYLQRL